MSTRRSVPAGVQFIGAVGGFAGALFALGTGALIVQSVQAGRFGLALRLLPMFALSVADVAALYGLVRLRRWGYVWTRRLFGLTLLSTLPAAVAGSAVDAGTVAFSAFVLVYLWLAETATFRPAVSTGADTPGDPDGDSPDDGPVDVAIGEPGEGPPDDADPLGAGDDADAGEDTDGPADEHGTDATDGRDTDTDTHTDDDAATGDQEGASDDDSDDR